MGAIRGLSSSRCPSGKLLTNAQHVSTVVSLPQEWQCFCTEPQLHSNDRVPGEAWAKRGTIVVVSGAELGVHGWMYTRVYLA